ncbi:hypothetical protein [Changchengzhania lutea]|uniref:hypothetical protein n=1 Tax=Changchengzhania lutea TaxID=2049305 RepID=UPI00115E2353|nr:hypothetical protein [Changchengzhania lutea]
MKFLIALLSIVILDNGCSKSKINQDTLTIEYTAQARGPYQHIKINKKTIAVISTRGGETKIKPCLEKDWNRLISILKTVDIQNIPNLEAPSEKRFYDGAAIARLKITHDKETFETEPFDHGNPPEAIAPLVKEILLLSENIE